MGDTNHKSSSLIINSNNLPFKPLLQYGEKIAESKSTQLLLLHVFDGLQQGSIISKYIAYINDLITASMKHNCKIAGVADISYLNSNITLLIAQYHITNIISYEENLCNIPILTTSKVLSGLQLFVFSQNSTLSSQETQMTL